MFGIAAYLLTGINVKFPRLGPNTSCTIAVRGDVASQWPMGKRTEGGFVPHTHRMSPQQPLKMLTPNQVVLMGVLWPERAPGLWTLSLESCTRSGGHNLGGTEKHWSRFRNKESRTERAALPTSDRSWK